ncbi:MAG TPA: tetratricopeptide repeat protein, partial [Tepidisphaeraceae bacterium]|nr:tetratricopeptide repeat protein [Tepidisphaeraceae bacterium]
LEVNPDSWNSHYELGYLLQEKATRFMAESGVRSLADRSTDEPHQAARTLMLTALEHYEQAVRINPQAVAARHGRALVLMHFGRYRQAADAFADVLRRRDVLAPENRAELDKDIDALGQCQYNLGRYADAIKSFESATSANPPVPGAAEHLAIARAALAASARTD